MIPGKTAKKRESFNMHMLRPILEEPVWLLSGKAEKALSSLLRRLITSYFSNNLEVWKGGQLVSFRQTMLRMEKLFAGKFGLPL
mmetsp:Transcript_3853/g.5183  ORF Transcript_3853/g.5183 Transcript_3853/m.5183 type:complete len:84 (-) Transcript_3853:104-355(-)